MRLARLSTSGTFNIAKVVAGSEHFVHDALDLAASGLIDFEDDRYSIAGYDLSC
jgi:hypothetical protein